MKNKLFLLSIFSAFLSCNQNENQIPGQSSSPIENDSLQIEKPQAQTNSTIKILSSKTDTLFFELKMDSANQHVTVPVKIGGGDSLFASLDSKDKKANIRISQLGFPDSTFDGPFGRDMKYKIKDTGNYKIIVGQNMMAGDRWKGNFTLKAWLK
jgi:hypothetical protein